MKHGESPKKTSKKGPTMEEPDLDEALQLSETSYEGLFNAIEQAIYLHDADGKILEVNERACAMYGYTREELIGRIPEFLAAPGLNDFNYVMEQFRQALAGEPRQLEFWGRRRDGEIFPKDIRLYKGRYFGRDVLIGVATDITGQKQAEKALRASEERYRHLLEAVTDFVFTVKVENGRDAGTVYGPGCEAVTGYTGSEFTADPGLRSRMVVEEDRAAVMQQAEKILAGKEAGAIEYRIMHKGAGVRWVRNTMVPRLDAAGRVIAYDDLIQDVTDQKLAEQAFVKSEEQLNALISTSPVPKFVIDNHHRVISWNRALENITGIAAREVLGTTLHWKAFYNSARPCLADLLVDGSHEEIKGLYHGKYQRSDTVEGAYEATDFFPHIGTGGKWLHFTAVPITDSGGRLIGAVETLEDITDLIKSQQALRESEERYSALFSNNYSVSLLIDPETGMIVDANDAAGRYYRYSRDQLRSMGIFDLNRLPRDKIIRDLVRAKNEREKHFFSTHYRADGEKRYVEVYSGPIHVKGKPLFYSIIHDITDSRLAEQELRESEKRYRTLIDHLPDYVIVHRDGILLYVNPAAAAHLGHDAKTLIGKSVFSFIAPEFHDILQQETARGMAGKKSPSYEMKIAAQDGTCHTVLVNGAAINFEGRPANLNVLSDITSLKQAEETIRSANQMLEKRVAERTEALSKTNEQLNAEIAARTKAEQEITRSLQEKDLLLREIHHRVKNNLQIIASLLQLQSRYITDENVLESIRNSQSRIRALALVHERIYRSPNLAEINLKDYLEYLTKQIFQFHNIPRDQIGIMVTMADIMADIDTVIPIGLIINELVSNSLKHAFPDNRKGTISIECTPQGEDMLRFVYHDNGIGMLAGFDWKNTESLGLRLVNSLVDQLDGTIDAGSGEGTTFILTIHRKQDSAHP